MRVESYKYKLKHNSKNSEKITATTQQKIMADKAGFARPWSRLSSASTSPTNFDFLQLSDWEQVARSTAYNMTFSARPMQSAQQPIVTDVHHLLAKYELRIFAADRIIIINRNRILVPFGPTYFYSNGRAWCNPPTNYELYTCMVSFNILYYCSLINIRDRAYSFSPLNPQRKTLGVCRSQPVSVRAEPPPWQ